MWGEFKASVTDPSIVIKDLGQINAVYKNSSNTNNRNGYFKFETFFGDDKYNRLELLGSSDAVGTTYPSSILRIMYDDRTQSTISSGNVLGSLEFYGLKSSNSSVGAKIVAETAEEWGSSLNDYPTELQFYTATSNGTTDGLSQRMVIDQEGFVGIGETSPLDKLHLKGPSFAKSALRFQNENLSNLNYWTLGMRYWGTHSPTGEPRQSKCRIFYHTEKFRRYIICDKSNW